MSDRFNVFSDETGQELHGSILRGISGSVAGMFVCILAMVLCCLCQAESFSIMLQFFVGAVIGWFYRLSHGRRSKTAACIIVGTCTVLACALWTVLLALLPAALSHTPLAAADWVELWSVIWMPSLLCVGLGLIGFFLTTKSLLVYADWKRGPWHVAYAGGNGFLYNLLPEKLPADNPPACFAVHGRFAPGTHIIVESSRLRWRRRLRRDREFSVHEIAGVVLGPSNGCNVLYDRNYQVLAKFAGSMEHADLMFRWLLQWNIPMDRIPAGWHSPAETDPDLQPAESSVLHQQFTLRLKRSTRTGFAGIGWFLLLLGVALFLAIDFSTLTVVDRSAIILLELAVVGTGIVSLRMGKVSQVKVNGEQMRVVSRFGRATEFSVRDVSSVSRSMGWIVLYDREFKTLAKLDSYLEDMDRLKKYLAFYGIKW